MSARAAQHAVEVLAADGIVAGLKIPQARPSTGFVRVMLLGGEDLVQRGVVVERIVEVEAWHPRPTPALDLADRALGLLLAAVGTRGIRGVWTEAHLSELPTGEDGWERYRFTVGLSYRTSSERIDQT